ncbi:Predicted ATPase [Nonomuraea solani]|uniref:Predicted ATPase n=1 Tax=Nonomuraea solani TaxID=1144553 RepID=A0A1H6EVC8_9ACTN|nr:XRE family transcriptional regulator [Nonomuraea solani]SEH01343.1 Predicted ATPase [Nonomuraea solani]
MRETDVRRDFAALLETLKVRSGRSYQALARRVGLSTSTVHRFCTGKQFPGDARVVERLAAAFGAGQGETRALLRQWRLADVVDARRSGDSQPYEKALRDDLPRDIGDFVGRGDELKRLLDPGGTAEVWTIDGMAGIGKTTLAVHAAHLLKERYPDIRLFLDLHGYSAGVLPMTTSAALKALLRAADVPDERIPAETDQRASLWRSTLAGRRALIVLDNAVDAAQVVPLLPGRRGCLTIVTSRTRLVDLDGAEPLSLGELATEEAVSMLGRVADADPAAAAEAVHLCGRLPLAIRIVTARVRHRPAWTVADLTRRLRREHGRLAELQAGAGSVEAAFALSYRRLGVDERRMFRLLGLLPGLDAGLESVAALAGLPPTATERLLERLVDAHMLQEPAPGRYSFHDLVRDHARATLDTGEPDDRRRAALHRLLDHYLSAADQAAHLLEPSRLPSVPAPEGQAPPFADRRAAITWLEREQDNLLAAIDAAMEADFPVHTWQLARALWHFFLLRGNTHDWIHTHRLALSAARKTGDSVAEAETLKNLGLAQWLSGADATAVALHHQALVLDCWNEDPAGQAKTLTHLGFVHNRTGELTIAADHFLLAVHLYQEVEDPVGANRALAGLGDTYRKTGLLPQALRCLREALHLSEWCSDRWGETLAHTGLGSVYLAAGNASLARHHFGRALELSREGGDRWRETMVSTWLGFAHLDAGSAGQAHRHFGHALELSRQTGDQWNESTAVAGLDRLRRTDDELT